MSGFVSRKAHLDLCAPRDIGRIAYLSHLLGLLGRPSWGLSKFFRKKKHLVLEFIWVFPKIGVPPNHPFVHRFFHYFHHPFWVFFLRMFGSTPIRQGEILPFFNDIATLCFFWEPLSLFFLDPWFL